jgi:hypothetical protein
MMVFPAESSALTVSDVEPGVPAGGAVPKESSTAATTPFITADTWNGCPAVTTLMTVAVASRCPVAFAASYCENTNESLAAGAISGTVQVRPASLVVQSGELLLMSAMIGVPPFTVVESDTADGETYWGLRAAAEVDGGIVRTTLPATSRRRHRWAARRRAAAAASTQRERTNDDRSDTAQIHDVTESTNPSRRPLVTALLLNCPRSAAQARGAPWP